MLRETVCLCVCVFVCLCVCVLVDPEDSSCNVQQRKSSVHVQLLFVWEDEALFHRGFFDALSACSSLCSCGSSLSPPPLLTSLHQPLDLSFAWIQYVFTLLFSLPLLPRPPQRCVRILFQDGERSAVRTLQWRAGESSQALAQLCADTFGVSDPQHYTLYWRSGGEMKALPPQAQPQDLAGHSEGGPSLSYLRTDHDFSKMRRLTRGGAVDLSESVCEE